ncbi:MAG: SGNH/GDSL hydrolase family protein [Terracidiphilus sp.]|jgi:phospholipase/lecithinase/hemolysin
MRVIRLSKPSPVATVAVPLKPLFAAGPTAPQKRRPGLVFCLLAVFLFTLNPVFGHAQDGRHTPDYTTIVVFGDSLSDTGNVADLTEAKYGVRIPGPYADYTDGRFTDGADTLPPAEDYFGVWIEQLAATFPSKPVVKASLDGGTDYAYGFAFTGGGTSVFAFGPSDELSVTINNIGQQITDYLATHPKINDKTLFVVWGGANDLLNATSEDAVIDAGINQTLNIQRLIDAGATQFIVPNLPPLGLVPRLNGSPTTSVPATAAAKLYNEVLGGGVALLRDFNFRKHLNLSQLDVFALFNKIVAAPSKYSLLNVTASSQGVAVDPDTYLFWDDLHPTTHGHSILAKTAAKLIAQSEQHEESVASGKNPSDPHANTLDESVTNLAGATH